MSRPPLASIIISSFNYAEFLGEAIESALRQTYPHTEVVVVDDGSEDDSRSIIASFSPRVRPVFKSNGGMASAWNAGYAASHGDLTLFLDADDLIAPEAIEQGCRLFDSPDVAKVHWPVLEADGMGRPTGRLMPDAELPEGNLRDRVIDLGPDSVLSPPIHGNCWSGAILDRLFPMPEGCFRRHSDTYLYTLVPLFGTLRRISTPLSYYRVHGRNDYASRPGDEKNRRNLELFDLRCEILRDQLAKQGVAAIVEHWKQRNPYYAWMNRLDTAVTTIKNVVPEGSTIVLADEATWADNWGGSEPIAGFRALPFTERDGRYWGPPADDRSAIQELERLRDAGADYAVFAWPAFWYFDHYTGFAKHVLSRYTSLARDEDVLVFRLR